MSKVTVRVRDGWIVYDGTEQRTGGQVLEVDADTAAEWVAAGWAEKATKLRSKPTS